MIETTANSDRCLRAFALKRDVVMVGLMDKDREDDLTIVQSMQPAEARRIARELDSAADAASRVLKRAHVCTADPEGQKMDGSLERGTEEIRASMSQGRRMACMEAAWEIEALAVLLMQLDLGDETLTPLQLRGTAVRIAQLAGVVMAGLDDEVVQERDLRRKLFFFVKETENG